MVNLNCTGTVHLAKFVVRHMVARNQGRILFTASIVGEMVAPREVVYAATKAFDLSLAHSIRYELRDTAITATTLQPGPTDTDFFHRAGMDNTEVGSDGKHESQPDAVGPARNRCTHGRHGPRLCCPHKDQNRRDVGQRHAWCSEMRHARKNGSPQNCRPVNA